ncbi:hypothetical protein MD484_g4438, partial [Candolleomyces efflorescens]
MVLGDGYIEFDPTKVKTVKPGLGKARGYQLSPEELRQIFEIDSNRFGELPGRIVIPVLEGHFVSPGWTSFTVEVTGYLYLVEPATWIPQVFRGDTIPASTFKTTYTKEVKTVEETKFTATTSASVNISAGGSYLGITVDAKASSTIDLKFEKTRTSEETRKTEGTTGKAVVELMVYPILQCKVLKKQRINYTMERRVADGRLTAAVRRLAYHPVPMSGDTSSAGDTWILPVPQVTSDGGVEITTLISRNNWSDWFHYDVSWDDCSGSQETIDVAAKENGGVAFGPLASWWSFGEKEAESKSEG